eukprot:TRINITY_DN1225_c1_g2_i1.p1 TRINITY_DN1225_c1_g2~~TRINITY_DN1225_c1_g2_i1.p1  ORF type:complete len:763 (-),score=100.60 TRINITY_DN1225_c1_g2_i1:309-2258(-)
MTQTSSVGVVTSAVVSLKAAEAAGGSVTIGGDSTSKASVTMPLGVLAQLSKLSGSGGSAVALTMTEISTELKEKLAAAANTSSSSGKPGPKPAGQPVSIVLYDLNGKPLKAKNLAEPMLITVEATEGAKCAFYDEDKSIWSAAGVRRNNSQKSKSGTIVCATDHLTIFAAVVGEFASFATDSANVLYCSNIASMLSSAAFTAVVQSKRWLLHPPTLVLGSLLFLSFLGFVALLFLDYRDCDFFKVSESLLLRRLSTKASFEQEEESKKASSCQKVLQLILPSGYDSMGIRKATLWYCVHLLHAHKTGLCPESLDTVKKCSQTQLTTRKSFVEATSKMEEDLAVGTRGKEAFDQVMHSRWHVRTMTLFKAFHPWSQVSFFSLFLSRPVRLCLFVFKLLSSFAVTAVFYQASGDATAFDSDPACKKPEDLRAIAIKVVTVGTVASIIGDGLTMGLAFLPARSEVYQSDWGSSGKAWQVHLWSLRSKLFWSLWLVISLFYILVIVIFLANVTETDGIRWLQSSMVTLIQVWIVRPLIGASALSSITSLFLLCFKYLSAMTWEDFEAEEQQPVDAIQPIHSSSDHCDEFCDETNSETVQGCETVQRPTLLTASGDERQDKRSSMLQARTSRKSEVQPTSPRLDGILPGSISIG